MTKEIKILISDEMFKILESSGEIFISISKEKDDVIYALCETQGRCPNCFRELKASDCSGCGAYYPECNCYPLTKKEIINGEKK